MISRLPNHSLAVAVCMACHNWQVDGSNAVRQELGGSQALMWAMAEAHNEHRSECPGDGGRIKVLGKWVERPDMASGKQADAVLGFFPYPRWWVSR